MNNRNILILDNNGTLSKFKNGNFSNTIGEDLKKNIKDYITDILSLNESLYNKAIEWIKNNGFQLSEGFEKLGVDRKEYFYNTWKNLDPEKYIIDRGNNNLRKLIEEKTFINIMITGAPEVWFKKSMKFLGYDLNVFEKIYKAEDFYNKKDVFLDLFSGQKESIIKKSIAIGDEENDYIHLQKIGGIGININKSLIYK